MHPGYPRIELSVGYSRSRTSRIVSLVLAGTLLVISCGCVGAILGVLAGSGENPVWSGVLALVLAGTAALFMVLVGLNTIRAGASLTGTHLTVTGLTSRTVDLRTAQAVTLHAAADAQTSVSSDGSIISTRGSTRTPVLTVTAPGATVKLRLRSLEGVLLPAGQMVALANALALANCPGAGEAVGWLRAMAADPRTMLL